MHTDRLAQLIARKLSGEASAEELEELESFLQQHPSDGYFVSLLHDYWQAPQSFSENNFPDAEKHLRHILAAAENSQVVPSIGSVKNMSRIRRKLPSIAAAVLAVAALSYFIIRSLHGNPSGMQPKREVAVKSGAKSRLLLPDGSTVWLNSESRLSYLPSFTDSLREVELEGEAYFDVVKNNARPFIVHTAGINIKVLGTAFNVRSYPGSSTVEATLIRGLIQVTKTGQPGSAALILHPHEKVVIPRVEEAPGAEPAKAEQAGTAAGNGMVVQQLRKDALDTAVVETAWVYNKLVFDGNNFREIADEMERWFNVKIIFHDPSVARYRFHVGFENEDINEVLTALQVSAPFTFKIDNNEVDIYKK